MTWNIRTSRQISADVDIFLLPTNDQGFLSIVLDATAIAADTDGVRRLRAGTILTKNGTSNQYTRYTGTGTIAGVLPRTIEVPDNTNKSDVPAELAFHSEVFRADRIIDYGTYGAALRTALPTCRFR